MSSYTADAAKQMLIEGNLMYAGAQAAALDASVEVLRESTRGQRPYAAIVTCSDSRVIPEAIFSAGIGDLFVIRVAGNVIGLNCLGSIEYAAEHLGTRLVVVLGHDHCGAVAAALRHNNDGYTKFITDEILKAVGSEQDETVACRLNVLNSCRVIEGSLQDADLTVVGAVYHLESGMVEFL